MIKFPDKPSKVISIGTGVITLDRDYEFELERHANGKNSYFARVLNTEVSPEVKTLIEQTIVLHAERDGVFNPVNTK